MKCVCLLSHNFRAKDFFLLLVFFFRPRWTDKADRSSCWGEPRTCSLTASSFPFVFEGAPQSGRPSLRRHGQQRAPSCCGHPTRRAACCVVLCCVVLCRVVCVVCCVGGWPHIRGQARFWRKARNQLISGPWQHQLGCPCRNAMAGETMAGQGPQRWNAGAVWRWAWCETSRVQRSRQILAAAMVCWRLVRNQSP